MRGPAALTVFRYLLRVIMNLKLNLESRTMLYFLAFISGNALTL